MGRKSKLSIENKILLYKAIIKPIWTYGIQLWGSASKTNIYIIQRFQSKVLQNICDVPWYVTNEINYRDLHIPEVKQEIQLYSTNYSNRIKVHPLAVSVFKDDSEVRRVKRFKSSDLQTRFN